MVTIYVGPERKAFRVHKEVACLYSPVLKAAFNSNFIEGQTQTYTLEGFDDSAFQLVVQWMYRQSITPPATEEETTSIRDMDRSARTTRDSEILRKIVRYPRDLVSTWLTADYLQIPRLQNYIVDQMEQLSWFQMIAVYSLDFLYEKVSRGAAIRELILEQCVRVISAKYYERNPEWFSKEFLLDYVIQGKRLLKKKQDELDPFRDRAEFKRRFHVPEEGNDSLRKETT